MISPRTRPTGPRPSRPRPTGTGASCPRATGTWPSWPQTSNSSEARPTGTWPSWPRATLLTLTLTFALSATTLPFETDFESDEGYSPGPLAADPVWRFGPDLDLEILSPGADSSQALGATGADWLWLETDAGGAPVAWMCAG